MVTHEEIQHWGASRGGSWVFQGLHLQINILISVGDIVVLCASLLNLPLGWGCLEISIFEISDMNQPGLYLTDQNFGEDQNLVIH